MASISLQGKSYFEEMVDGGVDLPFFHLIKPGFDETTHHCSLDVLPLLLEEASFPAREKSTSFDQDVCGISVLPEGGKISQLFKSKLTFLSFLGIPFASKDQVSLDAQMGCHNCIDFQMASEEAFSPCIVDINLENNSEMLKSDETVGNAKSEGLITNMQKVLQRQSSSSIDKSTSERVHDVPTNHWRRYRRAASFDSRRVVIFFSVLSSIGTMILIYLTLRVRVRQIGDGFHHF